MSKDGVREFDITHHGCLTGDCPHDDYKDCSKAVLEWIKDDFIEYSAHQKVVEERDAYGMEKELYREKHNALKAELDEMVSEAKEQMLSKRALKAAAGEMADALEYYGNRMDSGGTARKALEKYKELTKE